MEFNQTTFEKLTEHLESVIPKLLTNYIPKGDREAIGVSCFPEQVYFENYHFVLFKGDHYREGDNKIYFDRKNELVMKLRVRDETNSTKFTETIEDLCSFEMNSFGVKEKMYVCYEVNNFVNKLKSKRQRKKLNAWYKRNKMMYFSFTYLRGESLKRWNLTYFSKKGVTKLELKTMIRIGKLIVLNLAWKCFNFKVNEIYPVDNQIRNLSMTDGDFKISLIDEENLKGVDFQRCGYEKIRDFFLDMIKQTLDNSHSNFYVEIDDFKMMVWKKWLKPYLKGKKTKEEFLKFIGSKYRPLKFKKKKKKAPKKKGDKTGKKRKRIMKERPRKKRKKK